MAIIGGGPRGLAALEALARRVGPTIAVHVTLFEKNPAPGAGPNYAPGQTGLNLLNIPIRSISVPPGGGAGSFREWLEANGVEPDEDSYPSRALMGSYLCERFAMLTSTTFSGLLLDIRAEEAVSCRKTRQGWSVRTGDRATHGPYDEVLLCAGHQPVEDEQIDRWKKHAGKTGALFAPAYPNDDLPDATEWQGRTVAIRGFGLAMIDVTRVLTEGLGGRFEPNSDGGLIYRASGREPRLVPFSLNGMPPAPKPATGAVDRTYEVGEEQRSAFQKAVSRFVDAGDGDLSPVFRVLADSAGHLAGRGGKKRVMDWLKDGAESDPDVPDDTHPREAMERYLAMARGIVAPSVGYATGQIWRHFQNDLRKAYNPRPKSAGTANAMVPFDDVMKRFSYGPPAEATARLLALIEAGVLTLRRVDDPDIECVDQGWRVTENGDSDMATAMIDSVLPGPALDKMTAPLLSSLRGQGILAAMDEKLGARISADGQVIDHAGKPVEGLSMLGRLATGAVIATDSLHDCFGAAVERWVERVLAR